MNQITPIKVSDADDIAQVAAVALRRFLRQPASRHLSAKLLMISALALYAEVTSDVEAVAVTNELLPTLAAPQAALSDGGAGGL
jgi:hypothetical protein